MLLLAAAGPAESVPVALWVRGMPLGQRDSSGSTLDGCVYTAEATARTCARLHELAGGLLAAGWPVIVDTAFLRREERASFRALADEMGVGFWILPTEAPAAELRRRLVARSEDASEANIAVLERQLTWFEPLDEEETIMRHCDLNRQAFPANLPPPDQFSGTFMKAAPVVPTLIAALLIVFSSASDAARIGSRSSSSSSAAKSSPSAKPAAGKKAEKEEARSESGKGISVNFSSGGGPSSASGSSTAASAAVGAAAGIAAGAAAARISAAEDPQQQADQQSRQIEQARLADEKRRTDEQRKREEMDRLAREAEEDRQQEARRKAQENKRKEQLRQQAALESRCAIKPVMTDAEIARCR